MNNQYLTGAPGKRVGPCLGRVCSQNVLRIFARKTGQSPESPRVPSLRLPIEQISIEVLVALRDKDEEKL